MYSYTELRAVEIPPLTLHDFSENRKILAFFSIEDANNDFLRILGHFRYLDKGNLIDTKEYFLKKDRFELILEKCNNQNPPIKFEHDDDVIFIRKTLIDEFLYSAVFPRKNFIFEQQTPLFSDGFGFILDKENNVFAVFDEIEVNVRKENQATFLRSIYTSLKGKIFDYFPYYYLPGQDKFLRIQFNLDKTDPIFSDTEERYIQNAYFLFEDPPISQENIDIIKNLSAFKEGSVIVDEEGYLLLRSKLFEQTIQADLQLQTAQKYADIEF